MRRAIALLPGHASTASVLLSTCLLFLAGCSQGGASATGTGGVLLDQSEIVALKTKAKNPREFIESVKKARMEKQGIVLPVTRPGRVKKKSR